MTALSDIEKLAKMVAKEALNADNLQSKMDALKILMPYYVTLTKGKKADLESDEPTITDIQRKLRIIDG